MPPEFGQRLARYFKLLLNCVGIAAVIIVAVIYFTSAPSDQSVSGERESRITASEITPPKAAAPDPAPSRSTVPSARQPAVTLPSVAVPAVAEQLKREIEQVAAELRGRFPELPQALHVAAMMHAQLRQTAEAEQLWRKCIEKSPEHEKYYVNLAAVAMDRGNSELAAETLQQAVSRGMSSHNVFHHLAVALMDLGKCDESELTIDKALKLHPEFAAGWLVRGQSQLQQGKAAEAEVSLRKALELGIQSAEIYFALGNACTRQGKQAEAESFRKQFSELKITQPLDKQQRFQILSTAEARRNAIVVLSEAAVVHSLQGDSLEAERLLLRAIALDPMNAASCRVLADLYHKAGMKSEERIIRRRLVEIEPQDFNHYLNLAKVSAELGELETAEGVLKLAVSIQPDRYDAYAVLAQLYQQSGRAKHARWFAQEAVRRQPTAEGYLFLASTCQAVGDAASADAALEMARQLNPNHPQLQVANPREDSPSQQFPHAYGNG